MSNDVNRLPNWAQQRIRNLERTAESQAERIRELTDGNPESNTFVDRHGGMLCHGDRDTPLGKDPLIRFEFSNNQRWRNQLSARFTSRSGRKALELQGGSSLVIRPYSTNLVQVELAEW